MRRQQHGFPAFTLHRPSDISIWSEPVRRQGFHETRITALKQNALNAAPYNSIAQERSPVEAITRDIRSIAEPNSGRSFSTTLQTTAKSIPR